MPSSDPTTRVFRSDRSTDLHRARPWIRTAAAVAAGVLVVAALAGSPTIAAVAGVIGTVGTLLLVVVATSEGTLTVGHDVVELERWSGRRVALPLDEGLQGLRAPFASSLGHQSSRPRLVMRHPSTRGRISLVEGVWTPGDIEQISELVGVETALDLIDGRDWQARAPGLLPWAHRRPYTAIVVAVAVVLALLAVLVQLLG